MRGGIAQLDRRTGTVPTVIEIVRNGHETVTVKRLVIAHFTVISFPYLDINARHDSEITIDNTSPSSSYRKPSSDP